MEKHVGNTIVELMGTHEELWCLVDGMHSKIDSEAIAAARKNSGIVKRRSDLIEAIDETLIGRASQARQENCRNADRSVTNMAETFGSLIDKICINRLKIYHHTEKKELLDAGSDAARAIDGKLAILEEQGKDLAEELEQLLDDVIAGRKQIKVYRQFKM